eukprot:COSAG05_NODE_2216_length_3377_cov_3.381940_3_plen_93_part_00
MGSSAAGHLSRSAGLVLRLPTASLKRLAIYGLGVDVTNQTEIVLRGVSRQPASATLVEPLSDTDVPCAWQHALGSRGWMDCGRGGKYMRPLR